MKSLTVKLLKSKRKTNQQNENSLDNLASHYHITSIYQYENMCSFIFETMLQVLLLLVKV